jgi:hypothetical protein
MQPSENGLMNLITNGGLLQTTESDNGKWKSNFLQTNTTL